MFELGLRASFEAAHSLRGDFGPAQRLHGHTYRVDVAVRGPRIDQHGVLLDLGTLQAATSEVVGPLQMQNLDTLPETSNFNTTVEAMAQYVHREIAARLGARPEIALRITIWESDLVWASYEHDLSADAHAREP